MKKVTLVERLRYWFDNLMARGPVALIALLALVTAALILVVSSIVTIVRVAPQGMTGSEMDIFEVAWRILLRMLDAGTMGGDTGSPPFLFSMLVVTLGGVFVVSTLIGVITNGIDNKLQELRRGRSFVLEQNHTLILGWSPQIFPIISELVIANANRPRSSIVVLGNQDKLAMEEEIRAKVGSTGRTRIVCRTGDPLDLTDLEIVNPHTARSIIILAPQSDDPDTQVIKTILALTNNPNRRPQPYHIVAAIRNAKNMEIARLVGRDEAQLVLANDLISRITVQTCRQSGLSVVYTELLDFEGDEIYFKAEPTLIGKTFGEALMAYEDSSVIGVHHQDGRTVLNPPMDTPIVAGDQIIAISEDDDTIKLSGRTELDIDTSAIQPPRVAELTAERTLILGWNNYGPNIINELDNYVPAGSTTTVVASVAEAEAQIAHQCVGLKNQSVAFKFGDTTDRRVLDSLAIPTYQHVVVLSYSDLLDPQKADARTLITLLHLRDIQEREGHDLSIVSEMLDLRNRELAEVTRADDFIVSDQLISLIVSQVSENKFLNAVFADLFDPAGSEIYLKPAENYVQLSHPVNFYTVVEAARQRGEVAIGYRLHQHAAVAAKAYGVVVNPNKSEKVTFAAGDKLIVLAEE